MLADINIIFYNIKIAVRWTVYITKIKKWRLRYEYCMFRSRGRIST